MSEPERASARESDEGDAGADDSLREGIVLDGTDTVVTMLADADEGDRVANGESGLELREPVTFGHKVALVDHDSGDEIRKYGEVIGVAIEPIRAGEWVHTHNCDSVRGKADGEGSGTEDEGASGAEDEGEDGTEASR